MDSNVIIKASCEVSIRGVRLLLDDKINFHSLICHLDLLKDMEPWAKWTMMEI